MVLFDRAEVSYRYASVIMLRHKRIKIFNDKGLDEAKVRIEYYGGDNNENVSDITAETVTLNDNVIQYTPVDKSLIYKQTIDKEKKVIVFTFPNVKPGSVVEFKYKWTTPYAGNFPDWFFIDDIPTRYSEFQAEFSKDYTFKSIERVTQPFAKDTSFFVNGKDNKQGKKYIWALNNIHTLKDEQYITSMMDNAQCVLFQITGYSERTWDATITDLLKFDDFGGQLDTTINLNGQEKIMAKVNAMKTQDEKIAYIFNLVKSTITYNDFYGIYTDDGIKKAWNKKTGDASEINLLIYHFLKKAGIDVYTMLVNRYGKIDPRYASTHQVNKTVDYIRVDSTKQYVLDATNKYYVYNEIPFYLLNSNGLMIDPNHKNSAFIRLDNESPAKKVVFINAEITSGGKMTGTTQINDFSYNRTFVLKDYKDDGESKYKDELRESDNNLKILSFKMENMEADSLPLTQNIDFSLDLTGSDENYIYFSPNLFTGFKTNPFLSEERFSDIDFKYLNNCTIGGHYKIPAGYKVDAMPKNVSLSMPDKSITLKRIIGEEDGYIQVHYVVNFKRSLFLKGEYLSLRDFYKKLHELLNEEVVLKKV